MAKDRAPPRLCPSAQAEMDGAVVIGVIDHTDGATVTYLDRAVPVSKVVLDAAEGARPTEVLRFGAPCQTASCRHWQGTACELVDRVVSFLPPASLVLPRCSVRTTCRWFEQRGRDACVRCPQVVTLDRAPTLTAVEVAG